MDFTNTVRDLGSVEQSQEFASHMAEETVDAPAAVRRALNGNREALRQFAKEYRTRRPAYLLTSAAAPPTTPPAISNICRRSFSVCPAARSDRRWSRSTARISACATAC